MGFELQYKTRLAAQTLTYHSSEMYKTVASSSHSKKIYTH